ncbi:MspA family porin [Rhodococcus sp. BS-15]|uniref:MspA family porin n=1 Tax=unclassified Rhodococcus (in: high G+C Gram-positive bacteria) TaxID=192944 RepID=UPI000FFC538B|nr:MspA family porin [Rhodococcus sp. BS-15]
MNNIRHSVLRKVSRIAAVSAASAVAIGMLSVGAANADTFVPLPNGEKVAGPYKISHVDESAVISPAIANNPLNRNGWVTGTATADVPEGVSGTLKTGYLVGCQLDMDDLSLDMNAGFGIDGGNTNIITLFPIPFLIGGEGETTNKFEGGVGVNVPIKDKEVAQVELGSKDVKGPFTAIQYQDVGISVENCGGYAQARSYTTLELTGNYRYKGTLYGQPFSLG